jgi:hypothetical protein
LYLRELALTRLPLAIPARLYDAVGPALESADIDLQVAACDVVRRAMLVSDALSHLFTVFEGVAGWGGGFKVPEEVGIVSAQWRTFIAAHRSELESGTRFSLEDPAVTADLVPRGWTLNRVGKPAWPPGR